MPTRPLTHLYEGGDRGCLLLHGFSGSPLEMLPLARALAEEGWTVGVAELAGHTSPRALAAVTWTDWLESAEAGFRELRRRCRRIAVAGLSMGGAVGLCLAPEIRPAAVVAISTPVRMKRLIARASRVAARVVPYVPVLMKLGPREREMRRYRSPSRRIPLRATAQVERLLQAMREALPQVRAPLLIVQGRRDWVIPRESARQIAALAVGTETTVRWLPRSGHVATLDRDRALLFRDVAAFLRAHLDGAGEGGPEESGAMGAPAHGTAD